MKNLNEAHMLGVSCDEVTIRVVDIAFSVHMIACLASIKSTVATHAIVNLTIKQLQYFSSRGGFLLENSLS